MSHSNDPRRQSAPGPGPGFPVGVLLWLALLAAVGILVWYLDDRYPGYLATDEDGKLHIVRLISVLALVASGLIFARRIRVGETLRNLAIWIAIAAVVVVALSYRGELGAVYDRVAGELVPSQAVSVSEDEMVITASADGHFYIDGEANGRTVRFLIDTGASGVVLSPRDAKRIGIDVDRLSFVEHFRTANGVGLGAPYRLDSLTIGSFAFTDVDVSINRADMTTSLLGMSVLQQLSSYEVRDGRLYLRR